MKECKFYYNVRKISLNLDSNFQFLGAKRTNETVLCEETVAGNPSKECHSPHEEIELDIECVSFVAPIGVGRDRRPYLNEGSV